MLAWIDLTGGRGKKPLVRFNQRHVINFESMNLMDINNTQEGE